MYIFKNYTHIINYNEKTTIIKMNVDVAASGEVQAVNQGLGGTNPDVNDGQRQVQGRNAMWYTYQNSIRVICPGSQREISRISNVDISGTSVPPLYALFVHRFKLAWMPLP